MRKVTTASLSRERMLPAVQCCSAPSRRRETASWIAGEGGVAKMSASEEYDGDYDEKPDHFTFEVAWEVANKGEYMFLLVAFGIQASKIKYGYKVDIFSYLHLFLCCSFMKTVNVTASQTSLTNWLT